MTVPSARQVARGRADWWDTDKPNKPLTPTQAHWLRRQTRRPPGISKELARRGLLAGLYVGQPAIGLTPAGERVLALLGTVPERFWGTLRTPSGEPRAPSEAVTACSSCGKTTNVELIAWGAGGTCLACAQEGTTC